MELTRKTPADRPTALRCKRLASMQTIVFRAILSTSVQVLHFFQSLLSARSDTRAMCMFSLFDRKGLLDFMLESAFATLLHHAPTKYPARAARQWIPPSIPPEQLASGSRPVSRQSCSPVDPAQYPARAARQWIPPSIPLSIPE